MPEIEIAEPAQDQAIACNLSDGDQTRRRDEIAHTLLTGRHETRELPDGYALRFPGDMAWASRLLAFIAAERSCCPFLTFELVFEPGQGPLWLRLRGPKGTKAFLSGLLTPVAEREGAPEVIGEMALPHHE